MVRGSGSRKIPKISDASAVTVDTDPDPDMPLWASKLIERFDAYAMTVQSSFDRLIEQVNTVMETQEKLVSRLAFLEEKLDTVISRNEHKAKLLEDKITQSRLPSVEQKNILYTAMLKFNADRHQIEEKAKRITWIGIEEKDTESLTAIFDREILKEAIYSSGNGDLISAFENGLVSSRRHPPGKPRAPCERGRPIKIHLPSQDLRDALLTHMRSGRQPLAQRFVHSFARRDYTPEELELDRALRKEAGDRNAREGKLIYVVRDFDIVKLSSPRELPRRLNPSTPKHFSKTTGSSVSSLTSAAESCGNCGHPSINTQI
ncbi:hypothetical protein Q1695_005077 [Nippostrongylus brasiliensis]|nr:hypothetical protein Q1695_005077 [Nippostrongylus brasiliensis]